MKYSRKKSAKSAAQHSNSRPQQEWEKKEWTGKDKEDLEDEALPKWYEEFSEISHSNHELTTEEVNSLREEASQVLIDETAIYFTRKQKGKLGSEQLWLKTVLQKGTASDKVAAHVLKIQESPAFNISSITALFNLIKSPKKDFSFVIDALVDLLINDILPPKLKLRFFETQPLDRLSELSSGNAMTRRRRLAFWAFEDELKKLFSQFLQSLNLILQNGVEANKEKVISVLYKLLSSQPEQEDVLLKMIVNKLGDPSQKVASKVVYSLTQLLRVHDVMKQVVMDEIERLLFRPNISSKAQYYAICFLSQFNFTINDDQVACNVITIYFSFFKACVKKGDVNSRMLGSLIMGLNRAYPYAKKKIDTLKEHVNTLYKLVNLANFNVSLQCLSVLFQICDSGEDRFYCVLYKKLSDMQFATSAHKGMFINLIYKALAKDENIGRVRTFIKRILQLCAVMPVPLACALLYLVSQLINKRRVLSGNKMSQPALENFRQDDDDDEYYADVDIKDVLEVKEEFLDDSIFEPISNESNANSSDTLKEKPAEELVDVEQKADDSKELVNGIDKKATSSSWCHNEFQKRNQGFDALVRNPAFAKGESAVYEELVALTRHFHPTVSLFSSEILEDKVITYTGNPLNDFTLVRFIDRFVFKNPKIIAPGADEKGPDPVLAPRKYYNPSGAKTLAINSRVYLQQDEKDVPSDELFLFKYLKSRQQLGFNVTKKEKGDDDDDESDNDSVASEEFEEMLDNMMMPKKDVDFAEDIGDNLKVKDTKKQKEKESDEDDESDGDDDDDFIDDMDDEIDDGSDLNISDDDLNAEAIDFEDDDSETEAKGRKKGKKIDLQKLKNNVQRMFAPAEEFSEMLEETGKERFQGGSAQAVSNPDKAGTKQLQWEMKRNDFSGRKRKWKNNSFNKGKKKRN